MTLTTSKEAVTSPRYHNLGPKIETFFPKDVLDGNPHFGKLVDACLQAFETSRIQVYENGDLPYAPADKKDRQYFTIDPLTAGRSDVVTEERVRQIPMHKVTNEGETIYLKEVFIKKGKKDPITGNEAARDYVDYWRTDENGRPLHDKGKLISINVEPTQIVPAKNIDVATGYEVKAYTERDIVREEIGDLVAYHFKDLVMDPKKPDVTGEWIEATIVTPELINIMTDRKAHIEGIQKSHALNIVSAALQIARNPDTRVKIVSGFGASDTPASNSYIGNAIPALEMADKIRALFEERKAKGKRGLTFAPTVELVFAQEAGIQANFEGRADFVRARMSENMDLVGNFAATLYPEVPVVFNTDIPWANLTAETLAVIRYNAHLIRACSSHAVAETLADLVDSGHTKGTNGSSEQTAAEYSSIHPFVWGLKPDYIPTQYLQTEYPADVVIRVGPRTEAKFDAMIMAITTGESKAGFKSFVTQGGSPPEDVQQVIDSVENHQSQDRPTIALMTGRIGEHGPTYFTYGYDDPSNKPIAESLEKIQQEISHISDKIGHLKSVDSRPNFPELEALVVLRVALRARSYDLQAIQDVMISRLAKLQ